jgi:hypothetical protein
MTAKGLGPTFSRALARAIVSVLRRKAGELSGKTLDCLALDVHPWSGFINLAIRQVDDAEPRVKDSRVLVADWELSDFAVAHEPDETYAWSEAAPLAATMKLAFERNPASIKDGAFARDVYGLCAEAARDLQVWRTLDGFSRAPEFCIAIADVDSPKNSVFVSDPRTSAKHPKRASRRAPRHRSR